MARWSVFILVLASLLILLACTPQATTETGAHAAATAGSATARPEITPGSVPTQETPSTLATNLPATPDSTELAQQPAATPTAGHAITTVFLIMMENHNWADIEKSRSAPYINTTLLPMASYAQRYYNPPGIHPSEPNYLWLEAGTNFSITDDAGPSANHQATHEHLVTLLTQAGISWTSYQEDISRAACPLVSSGLYAPKHNPMVYFDDVTDTNDPHSATCIAHVRPYTELAAALQQNSVARYNFITPNLCNDMHGAGRCISNLIAQGDAWLAAEVPRILNSQAYQHGGVLFITWDEGEGSDGPIGMIVLSPLAKGGGYANSIHYTHSSTLRTLEEIFGVTPLLGDAAQATDLRDLFAVFP